jgi:hypothetical protein
MKIYKNLDLDILNDPGKVDSLKQEAANYLKKMAISRTEALLARSDHALSPKALEHFFRSRERNEKIRLTMQYLLRFLAHIPGPAEIAEEPVNPVEQFREFIRYQVNLLREEDVKNAVFREVNQAGSLSGGNVWGYQERIVSKNKELLKQIAKGGSGTAKTIAALCRVLEQLCQFWLEVKHGDMRRTRRSDIYLYQLARIIQGRCQL